MDDPARVLLTGLLLALAPLAAAERGELCLNGTWRFMPAVGPAAEAPTADWGALPVPGSWSGTSGLPGPTTTLQTGPWAVGRLAEVTRGWYETDVNIPAAWAGQAVWLDVGRVSTDAVVYANGVACGAVAWPRGEVDLTKAVQPGARVTLRLLVVATPEAKDVTVYMGTGNDQTWTQPARLASRGMIGEVFLRSRPAGAHVADLFIQPSVRQKSLRLEVDLANAPAGATRFEVSLLDDQGQVERRFEQQTNLTAGQRTVRLDLAWDNPRLWELGRPELYTLELRAAGPGLDDTVREVFGFREFWIDGLDFYLNGTPIRLRPINVRDAWNQAAWVPAAIEQMLRGYTAAGFNLGEHWPNDEDERGSVFLRELWAEAADRQGFLLAGCALSMNGYIYDSRWRYTWEDAGVQDRYRARLASELRRLRNHPSIVMWATSANFFGRGQDQNPTVLGRRGWYEHDQKARAGLQGVAIIKSVDPTRPVFTHHGADIGDLHTCNNYLDLIPLQEREEWLSSYVTNGEIPYCPIEFGTPLHCTLMRNRNGFGNTIVSEPLLTEFCAIYLGAEAYAMETAAYRQRLQQTYEGGDRWKNWQNAPEFDQAPAFQALLDLFTLRQVLGDERLAGARVAIVGDVLHSRVARSDIWALTCWGVDLWITGPTVFLRGFDAWARALPADRRLTVTGDLATAIGGADAVMALRVQRERLEGAGAPSEAAYAARWGISEERLVRHAPDAIVMHPGPVNEGVELPPDVVSGPRSVITRQVANGVPVRLAAMGLFAGSRA